MKPTRAALRERKKHRRFIWLPPREKQIAPHSARRRQIESAAMKVNFGFGSITRAGRNHNYNS
jgi:phage-related protein